MAILSKYFKTPKTLSLRTLMTLLCSTTFFDIDSQTNRGKAASNKIKINFIDELEELNELTENNEPIV